MASQSNPSSGSDPANRSDLPPPPPKEAEGKKVGEITVLDVDGKPVEYEVEIVYVNKDGMIVAPPDTLKVHEKAQELLEVVSQTLANTRGVDFSQKEVIISNREVMTYAQTPVVKQDRVRDILYPESKGLHFDFSSFGFKDGSDMTKAYLDLHNATTDAELRKAFEANKKLFPILMEKGLKKALPGASDASRLTMAQKDALIGEVNRLLEVNAKQANLSYPAGKEERAKILPRITRMQLWKDLSGSRTLSLDNLTRRIRYTFEPKIANAILKDLVPEDRNKLNENEKKAIREKIAGIVFKDRPASDIRAMNKLSGTSQEDKDKHLQLLFHHEDPKTIVKAIHEERAEQDKARAKTLSTAIDVETVWRAIFGGSTSLDGSASSGDDGSAAARLRRKGPHSSPSGGTPNPDDDTSGLGGANLGLRIREEGQGGATSRSSAHSPPQRQQSSATQTGGRGTSRGTDPLTPTARQDAATDQLRQSSTHDAATDPMLGRPRSRSDGLGRRDEATMTQGVHGQQASLRGRFAPTRAHPLSDPPASSAFLTQPPSGRSPTTVMPLRMPITGEHFASTDWDAFLMAPVNELLLPGKIREIRTNEEITRLNALFKELQKKLEQFRGCRAHQIFSASLITKRDREILRALLHILTLPSTPPWVGNSTRTYNDQLWNVPGNYLIDAVGYLKQECEARSEQITRSA